MSGGWLIALSMLIPFAGAGLIAMSSGKPNQRETVTIVTAVLLFAVNILLAVKLSSGESLTLKILEPEDWAEIDAAFASNEDPLFGAQKRREFKDLVDWILELAPSPLGFREEAATGS